MFHNFDFFFRDAGQLARFVAEIEALRLVGVGSTRHHVHHRGRVLGRGPALDVQCIRFAFHADAAALVDGFDYTLAMFAFDGTDVTFGETSLSDVGRREVVAHRITYPASSLARLRKYERQGYHVPEELRAEVATLAGPGARDLHYDPDPAYDADAATRGVPEPA